jgi:DNA-binding winged helix-turn-helix (wHTH) protein/tetratricopeptide (TPR) repeat protein
MAPLGDEASYLFDGFRLDPVRGMLFDAEGTEVRLRPKPFALLRCLLDNPGRLFAREELLETLWPGVIVTDDALTQCISELRRALGDRAVAILRTVPRRGHTLASTVTRGPAAAPEVVAASAPSSADAPQQPATRAVPLAMQRRDAVLVMPVGATPGDTAAERLAPALTADLLTELVRFEDLRVVAGPDSSYVAGFALHAQLHSASETMRVAVRLEDIATGTAFWADRLEWPAGSGTPPVAALAMLAGAVDLHIWRKSLRRAEQKPLEQRTARECCLVGRSLCEVEDRSAEAVALFSRAAELDPGYAGAHAWHALTVLRLSTFAKSDAERWEQAQGAMEMARLAVRSDPESAVARSALALALAFEGRTKEAADAARLGLRFGNATHHGSRMVCAEALAVAGCPLEAVEALRETLALDPRCPPRIRAVLGRALLLADRPEEALVELRQCAAQMPDFAPCHGSIVVAAIETGLIEEARAALAQMRRLHPDFGRQPYPWFLRRPEHLARFEQAFSVAERLDAVATAGGLINPSATRS